MEVDISFNMIIRQDGYTTTKKYNFGFKSNINIIIQKSILSKIIFNNINCT